MIYLTWTYTLFSINHVPRGVFVSGVPFGTPQVTGPYAEYPVEVQVLAV